LKSFLDSLPNVLVPYIPTSQKNNNDELEKEKLKKSTTTITTDYISSSFKLSPHILFLLYSIISLTNYSSSSKYHSNELIGIMNINHYNNYHLCKNTIPLLLDKNETFKKTKDIYYLLKQEKTNKIKIATSELCFMDEKNNNKRKIDNDSERKTENIKNYFLLEQEIARKNNIKPLPFYDSEADYLENITDIQNVLRENNINSVFPSNDNEDHDISIPPLQEEVFPNSDFHNHLNTLPLSKEVFFEEQNNFSGRNYFRDYKGLHFNGTTDKSTSIFELYV
jgi:hypothetical protein